jgi:hypothetical protein
VKIFILLSLFISYSAFAQVKVHLHFKDSQVTQGAIAPATVLMGALDIQSFSLIKAKGTSLGEIFYLYQVSPFLRSAGSEAYEAQADIIITKALPPSPLKFQLQGQNVELSWDPIEFKAIEAPKGFIFENFEIPTPLDLAKYALILLVLSLGGIYGYRFWQTLQKKKALKLKRSEEKKKLLGATDYGLVVSLWKNKAHFLNIFPEIESDFKKLEDVLFKFQFKQTQTAPEMEQVMAAYRSFTQSVSEVLRGV